MKLKYKTEETLTFTQTKQGYKTSEINKMK